MPPIAAWSDKEVSALLLGTAGLVTAASYGLRRLMKQRGENAAAAGKLDGERRDRTFREMKQLVKTLTDRVGDQDDKIEARDAVIAQLHSDVAECRAERATFAEQVRWMRRILRKAGLLSDEDDSNYPRTASDQIDTGGGK